MTSLSSEQIKFSTSITLGSVTQNLISFPDLYNELYHTGTTPVDTGLPYIGSFGISDLPTLPYTPYSSAKTFLFGQNNGQFTMVEVCQQGLKIVFVLRRLSHQTDMKRKI